MEFDINYKDPQIQHINNVFNNLYKDSLSFYLYSDIPKYRFYSLQFFNSESDSIYIDKILPLLSDPHLEVRTQAVISLGNIRNDKVLETLIKSFINEDSTDVNNLFNRAILEAVGKLGTINELRQISTVTRYRPKDNHLLLGQILSIYQFGLRGIFSNESTDKAVSFLLDSSFPEKVRMISANYLARFKNLDLAQNIPTLIDLFNKERDPVIRSSLATIITNYPNNISQDFVVNSVLVENDYRVLCNVIRGLKNFDYKFGSDIAYKLLNHKNTHVSTLASEYFYSNGNSEEYLNYFMQVNDSLNWEVNSNLLSAAMKFSPLYYTRFKSDVSNRMNSIRNKSNNFYEKRALILGLCEDPFILEQMLVNIEKEKNNLLKLAMIEGVIRIVENPLSQKAFGFRLKELKSKIISVFIKEFDKHDPVTMGVIATFLRNPKMGIKEYITEIDFLKVGMNSLKLPRDLETRNEIFKTIQIFESDFTHNDQNNYFKSINWSLLRDINDSFNIEVKTTKGNFKIELYPEKAIVSVLNFIELINQDFYDGMEFHRVVSNFVVQTGCPRGDGLGGLDYLIRTESNNNNFHEEGLVGMASSGQNTESCQFFINTSPAPHLDGRYTVFGKVISGMDVVNSIQRGDKIIDIILLKFIN